MPFKVLFLAHAPHADRLKHRNKIDTGLYQLTSIIVRNQREALATAVRLVEEEGIESILLCPGFTHANVAEIAGAVGPRVAVSVARGDGPSGKASAAARGRAYRKKG